MVYDEVALALERDLEEERRERREQVGFLQRMCNRERELLNGRAESLNRQLLEAKELWERERVLLNERLAHAEMMFASFPAARFTEEHEAALQRNCREEAENTRLRQTAEGLELQLKLEHQQMEAESLRSSAAAEEFQTQLCAIRSNCDAAKKGAALSSQQAEDAIGEAKDLANRLREREREKEELLQQMRQANIENIQREGEATMHFRNELNEQLQAQSRAFNQEVSQLRFKIQSLEHAQQQSEREAATRLEKVEAKSKELCLRVRQEFAEEEESSLMRALLQLQVADDCMQTLRERHKQESDACAACRVELVQYQQQLAQETSAYSRLRLSLSHAESERDALSLKTQQLEDSIQVQLVRVLSCSQRQLKKDVRQLQWWNAYGLSAVLQVTLFILFPLFELAMQ